MKRLVTGRAAFVDDHSPAGLVHLGLVSSPHEHARILSVDTSAARALPGVVDVMTALDQAAGAERESPRLDSVLSVVARYAGAPVAIVAAEDPEIAKRASEVVSVRYEPLPAVRWSEREERAAAVPEQLAVASGDVERAFAEADRVVEVAQGLARTRVLPLEPPVSLAWLDEDGRLVVRSATASPLRLRRALADALGLPGSRIRVERPEVGGDFGARDGVFLECACALGALRTGRPARLHLRPDHPAGGFQRAACAVLARAAIRDRTLTAIHVRLLQEADGGSVDERLEASLRQAAAGLALYDLAAARFEVRLLPTNAPPTVASAPLGACLALEALVDEAALQLGEDPLAFRKRHLSVDAHDAGLGTALDRCAKEAGFGRRLRSAAQAPRRGFGSALARSTLTGADATATGFRNEDASFTVTWSPCEWSTTAADALEALLARTLGVANDRVTANLAAAAEPPASGIADLWLTAQAVEAVGREMGKKATFGSRGASPPVTVARRVEDAPAPLGACAAEVEVDAATGAVTLVRLVQVLRAGATEALVEAKAEGDAMRGASVVLFDAPAEAAYVRPRTTDLPEVRTILAPSAGSSPWGDSPIGEVAALAAAAAVANAVAQAAGGRILELPVRPADVLDFTSSPRS